MDKPPTFGEIPNENNQQTEQIYMLLTDATLYHYISDLSPEKISELSANQLDKYLQFVESFCQGIRDDLSESNLKIIRQLLQSHLQREGLSKGAYGDLWAAVSYYNPETSTGETSDSTLDIQRVNMDLTAPAVPASPQLVRVTDDHEPEEKDDIDIPVFDIDDPNLSVIIIEEVETTHKQPRRPKVALTALKNIVKKKQYGTDPKPRDSKD